MVSCALIERDLPQYIADGELALPVYSALRAHLAACPACSAYAAQLRLVEDALRTYPLAPIPVDLAERVRAIVDAEGQSFEEEWHVWQWDLGLPALALLLAMAIAILALPSDFVSWGSLAEWARTPVAVPPALPDWLDAMRRNAESSVFWAVWIGVFVTTAGLGIGLSLAGWERQHSRRLSDIESRVGQLANRVWETRRAR